MSGSLRLEAETWTELEKMYGLRNRPSSEAVRAVRAADLLQEQDCADYLDELSVLLRSPSRIATASLFAKRYAALTAVPLLYAMTRFDMGIEMSLSGTILERSLEPGSHWLSRVALDEPQVSVPEPGRREEWRARMTELFFSHHLTPLLQAVSRVSGAPLSILWENAAVRLYSLYEKKLSKGEEGQQRLALEDLEYLVHAAPAGIFGQKRQPLRLYYGDASQGEKRERIRKTCCLYYQVSSVQEYCEACPKLACR